MNGDTLALIDTLLTAMADEGKIAGAVALVARDGKIVYNRAFGYSDIEAGQPMTTEHLFRIASMTKPVVSVAIMQLYEAGMLRLTDPVSLYIPSFESPSVLLSHDPSEQSWLTRPASREITIHHLLTHTSGIGYGFNSQWLRQLYSAAGIPDMATTGDISLEDKMSVLGTLPLLHDPGVRFTYGLSTDVLGRVVEVVSGMTLGQYIHKNITSPLKMEETRFFYPKEMGNRFANLYSYDSRRQQVVPYSSNRSEAYDFATEGAKRYFSGGSGLSSTITDYYIFCQAILNGGEYRGTRILSEESVDMMTGNRLRGRQGREFGYGFGIERGEDPHNPGDSVVTHLGWAGAFGTWFTINPSSNVIAIVMTQVVFNPWERELTRGFRNAVNASTEVTPPLPSP